MDLEGVDEPLRLPVGVVEEEPDEGEAPDVRLRVAVGLPDLTVVGLPQFPPPPLGGRGPAPPLTSASLYLCQSLSVDMRSERGGGVEAHSNQNCSIESNHATRQKRMECLYFRLRGIVPDFLMARFNFDDQIASEPEAVRDVIKRIDVPSLDRGRPLLFTGIGTSLHVCRVAAAWVSKLSGGRLRPPALEAHEFGLMGPIRPGDQIVVVSHRGTKTFPNMVLERARAMGASTVLVTGFGVEHPLGDRVLRTCRDETASTHSVSYVTALAALGLLVSAMLGEEGRELRTAIGDAPEAMKKTMALPVPRPVVDKLASSVHILLTGFDLDEITAEEAALKLKEGAYVWAEGMSTELALHGTPAVFGPATDAITLVPAENDGGRTQALRGLLEEVGATVFSCGSGDEYDLRFAAVDPLARPLVSIIPLQRLTAEVARVRGTNPDTTHGDTEPWASAIKRVRL